LGNYFGAINQLVELQKKNECFLFVADLHALTVPQKPNDLRKQILDSVANYLALGINPKKCLLFIQSQIPAHAELAWILDTLTPLGELERMTQFKEKVEKQKSNINAGLFTYPILMAADILLYQSDVVPVGEDQVQHLELARTIARKFNSRFGKTFKEPKSQLPKSGARIMALTDPKQKMSKSLGLESYIGLFDKPGDIERKIKHAVTDSGREIKYDEKNKPAISNLLSIYSLVSGKTVKALEKEFKGKGYAEFKKSFAREINKFLEPFRGKRKKINDKEVLKILENGRKKAAAIAETTLKEVKEKVGLLG
jgi:tryptophanyl-tRNA synthetase